MCGALISAKGGPSAMEGGNIGSFSVWARVQLIKHCNKMFPAPRSFPPRKGCLPVCKRSQSSLLRKLALSKGRTAARRLELSAHEIDDLQLPGNLQVTMLVCMSLRALPLG